MLPYSYKQREGAPKTAQRVKNLPYVSLTLKLLSLALFVTAFFFSYYVIIGAAIMLLLGIGVKQYYYSSTAEYIYIFTPTAVKIHTQNVLGTQKPVLSVDFDNVLGFDRDDGSERNLCVATEQLERFKLVYVNGKLRCALLFSPDEYMRTLIKAVLNGEDEQAIRRMLENEGDGEAAKPLHTYNPEESSGFSVFGTRPQPQREPITPVPVPPSSEAEETNLVAEEKPSEPVDNPLDEREAREYLL